MRCAAMISAVLTQGGFGADGDDRFALLLQHRSDGHASLPLQPHALALGRDTRSDALQRSTTADRAPYP